MKRERRRLGALAAFLGSVLAACSGAGAGVHGQSSSPASAGSSTASSSSTASASSTNPASAGSGSSSSGISSSGPTVTPVRWVNCDGQSGPKGFQCATVEVPRDPQNPALGSIAMAIDRRKASGSPAERIGSLLVNPGGPGVSGVSELPGLASQMPKSVLDRFDVVGFDPPGVGRTAPVTCLGPSGLSQYFTTDPAPSNPSALDDLIAEDRRFAYGCEHQSGTELPYVSTVDAAMDMDVVRQALGDAKLTYLGYSYGTLLGATYAGLYPTHVRAMVLDGPLDPSVSALSEVETQAASLEGELHQFFSACSADRTCPWTVGQDPEAAIQALLERSQTSPLPAQGTSRTVGPAAAFYGILWPLYYTETWPELATALEQASAGNGTGLLNEFDSYTGRNPNGTYGNLFEANAAIDCLDQPAPSPAQIQAAVPAAEKASPVFGLAVLYGELQCTVWPVAATGKVAPIRAAGSPPIVVVGSTGDPITPYAWAQSLASQLRNGVLLTRVGDGHTSYASSACIRTYVDRYLTDLASPAPGTRCPSDA